VDIATAQKGTKEPVSILNPLTVEMNALRSSLVTGLLETIAGNIRHGNKDLRLFEIGHVFSRDASSSQGPVQGYAEVEKVAFCLTGLCSPPHWSQDTRQVDFFDMKGEVATLLARLSLDKGRFISYRTSDSLVEHAMSVEINGSNAGYLGSVRAEVLKSFGIDQEVIVAEFRADSLRKRAQARYEPLPRFPRVRRDVAFIVDTNTPSARIGEVILSASSGLLTSAEVFDLYEGDPLPSGKKSLAFALEIVPREKTLTDSEIDQEVGKAVRAVEHTFGAQLRSMPGSGR
jgi:phenylalanyl-tRNA synthetase beta chain